MLNLERQGENTKLMLQKNKKIIQNDHDSYLYFFFWSQKRGGAVITGGALNTENTVLIINT